MAKGKGKSAVVEDMDDELELVADDDEAPVKTSKSKSKTAKSEPKSEPKAESTGMGVSWLAEYVNEELDKEFTPAQIRVILRRMAADGDIEREVGTDRARYSFTGEKDPTVRALLKRIKSGEADNVKADRIEAARSGKKGKSTDDAPDEPKSTAKRRKAAKEDEAETAPKPVARRRRKSEDE